MIGGTIFSHDCLKFDYCLKEAIESLLGVCSEVVCVDADSTDGTKEMLQDWSLRDPRLRIIHAEWKPVVGTDGAWLADLANRARKNLTTPFHLACQADEAFYPDDYPLIRQQAEKGTAALCHRFNFWKDHKHLVPHGHVCGHMTVRIGPSSLPFVGDAESLQPRDVTHDSKIRIAHVGFIRRPTAFLEKSRSMQLAWHGSFDTRLQQAESTPATWTEHCPFPEPLIDYTGDYPPNLVLWLKERGMNV